jgi:histidine phosphotransferase ChpT
MDLRSSLQLAELLAARICHDLVGPVGAVVNGTELLADANGKADAEIVAHIAASAASASRRLQYFRTAFGSANALSSSRPFDDARALVAAYYEGGKIALDWRGTEIGTLDATAARSAVKTLLILMIVAQETLPRGGRVGVRIASDEAALAIVIESSDVHAKLPDEIRAAIENPGSEAGASPRGFPARLAQLIATAAGGTVSVAASDARVTFSVRLPRAPNL